MARKILKIVLYVFIALIVIFASFLIFATIDDYKPDEKIVLYKTDNPELINDTLNFNILIWNIGYCGLNAEMDFFYDGGENVRPDEEIVWKNIAGVKSILKQNSDFDFYMLQEVDKKSKRSYRTNQYDTIASLMPSYKNFFGKNYDVAFVPIPISNPMGKVKSGLMTLSKFDPVDAIRYSFPGNYSWPTGLFMLDRCFLVTRYSLSNQKELLIINTHNSAYDDGSLRDSQMKYLKEFIEKEYKQGNYVIIGGDWNQCPPEFTASFNGQKMDNSQRKDIEKDYLSKDWTWAYDNTCPSNRRVTEAYKKGQTLTTVIDFYLLSPNVELQRVKTINVDFKYSDHQPVALRVKLR